MTLRAYAYIVARFGVPLYTMSMHKIIGTILGKGVRHVTKLRGSGGQALPGLVVERLFPQYLASMLAQLPEGVIVITGTNGKTTTTKMVVELLQANGKRVLTNPTGSNFTRGIISSLTHQAKSSGKLPFDIGVFELDEAYARLFVAQVKPRWVLALNVMRDQLDRFGELDTAAKMIGATMHEATTGIIVNGDDKRLAALAASISKAHGQQLLHFGVAPGLRKFFPADDELVAVHATVSQKRIPGPRAVELTSFKGQRAGFAINGQALTADLQLNGQHNFQNAAAALALAHVLLPKTSAPLLIRQLSAIQPAFGRGETFTLPNGSTLQLLLVKNPAGFRQTLASYPITERAIMFAINDQYADSRDVSWLWDVDFSMLSGREVPFTTGSRAADMALRLSYDGITVKQIEPNLEIALDTFCKLTGDKLLVTTYTPMLRFHKILKGRP